MEPLTPTLSPQVCGAREPERDPLPAARCPPSPDDERRLLAGLRVLDLADESGAYCGRLLADLGAEVIKVEPPGGDPSRRIGPFLGGAPDPDRSLFFRHFNAGKHSIVLDLDQPAQRARLDEWLAACDAVVVTGTPAALADRGLDPATLAQRHPHLVVAAIAPFGLSGPRAEWRSCDTVAQALGGMLFVNGHPDEPPLRGLGAQAYHCAGLHAAIGVVLALLARGRTGGGQVVDVSLQESVLASVEHVAGRYFESGEIATRRGTLHWSGAFRVGQCRDGPVLLSHLGDWTALLEWLKADGAAQDLAEPRWEDEAERRAHCAHVFDVLAAWAARYRVAELVDAAQLRRLPFAPVLPLRDIAHHSQLQARGFFVELNGAKSPPTPLPQRGEETPPAARSPLPAPRLPQRAARSPLPACALAGLRVLDFTWVVAGPVATRLLADHGADVIKIERLDAPAGAERRGGLHGTLNRGKRSVAVDLADPRGRALVQALAGRCDVVIDNFSRRVLPNWGLDGPTLRRRHPRLIALSLSGFGHTGPLADWVAYGPSLHAQTGFTWHMRHPGGRPAGWGFSYSDMVAGASAALAVLAALWERERTGEGRVIDLSQLEVLAALIGPALLAVLHGGAVANAFGNDSPERPAAPHGVYRCRDRPGDGPARDRWCAIAVFGDQDWGRFAAALGHPAWASAPRFATLEQRLAHAGEIDLLVEAWTAEHDAEWVMETLQRAGVAAGIAANAADLCRGDPHLAARGYWTAVGGVTVDGVVPRLSATPGCVAAPGPLLGEHTDAVLREVLGLEQSALDQLRADRIIG